MSRTRHLSGDETPGAWRDTPSRARDVVRALRPPDQASRAPFDPAQLDSLPEPARRWLAHAIEPGCMPPVALELRMHGEIRLGRWRPFTATQLLVPDAGFVWCARTRLFGVPVTGFDAYARGRGLMRWRAAGLLPVQSGSGTDVALSAVDRLAAESVLLPGSLIDAAWCGGPDPDSATYARAFGDRHRRSRATVHVLADGRLARVSMHRWGKPEHERFGLHPFDVAFDGEYELDGIRIGDGIRAAWLDPEGARREFYRASIDASHHVGAIQGWPSAGRGVADPRARPGGTLDPRRDSTTGRP